MAIRITYYREKYNRYVAFYDEWKPIDLRTRPWRYWRGNVRMFGWKTGMISNLTLTSPLMNKMLNWRYGRMRLDIPYTTRDTLDVIDGGKND